MDYPAEAVTKSHQRSQVSQSEQNFSGLQVDGGIRIGLPWSVDSFYAPHSALKTAEARDGFPRPGPGLTRPWVRSHAGVQLPEYVAISAPANTHKNSPKPSFAYQGS